MSWFFDILWAIIGGGIIGVIARFILPGKQNISLTTTVIAGMIAALVGGFLARLLGVGETKGVDWIRHGIQIVLAVIAVSFAAKRFPAKNQSGITPPTTTGQPPASYTGSGI